MKETFKKLLSEGLLYLCGGFVCAGLALLLGCGESRTGRYSGVDPWGLVVGAFALGIFSWRSSRVLYSQKKFHLGWVLYRTLIFLLPWAWAYTSATGMIDKTYDLGPTSIPFVEGVVSVYSAWLTGLAISAICAGVQASWQGIARALSPGQSAE